jgi:hypothetical protein
MISFVEFMLVVKGIAGLLPSVNVPKYRFLCSKMFNLRADERLGYYQRAGMGIVWIQGVIAVVARVQTVLIFVFCQRDFNRGLPLGPVKG